MVLIAADLAVHLRMAKVADCHMETETATISGTVMVAAIHRNV